MPSKKCITHMFQVLACIYVASSYNSYDIQCPHSSQWKLRAPNDCNATSQYYCLFDELNFMYTEFCERTPDFEGPGYKLVILGGLNGRICAAGRYQPFIFWTNGSSKCTFQKSLCREEGQMIVNEYSASKDTTCRCDYASGYSFLLQPKTITYCVPSEEDCSCYRKQCPNGYMLNAVYQCIAGSLDKNESTTTDPFISSESKSTAIGVLIVYTESDRIVLTREKTVPEILILITIALIVIIYYNISTADNDTTNSIDVTVVKDTREILVEGGHAMHVQPVVQKQQSYLEYANKGTNEYSFKATKALACVCKTVRTTKITVISGPPGCGKSSLSYHAAMELGVTDNYKICVVSNPMQLIDSINTATKQIFVMDDVVGKYSLNDYSLQTLRAASNWIKQIIGQSLNTKLILTCRSYIYRNEKFSLLRLPHIHCDLLADELCMTKEERLLVCRCYVSAEKIQSLHENVMMLYSFFPLICMRYKYKDAKHINEYFTHPYDIIENEMIELRISSDPCFLALGLLVIYNNNIDKESLILHKQNQTTEIRITDVLSDMLQDIDYGYTISLKGITVNLSLLENIYLSETALTFTCINQFMFDMLVGTVGRHFIPCILKHSDSKFIKDYIELSQFSTHQHSHTIQIESKYELFYFRRILNDINNGFNWEVFETVQMESKAYRVFFLENILKTEKPTFCKSKKDGSTPLHIISLLGYNDLSFFFIENDKSQINSRDNTGKTPLHMACLNGNAVIAKVLIKSNAEVNQMDSNKVTPLMLACSSSNIGLVKFLLTKDVNVNALNSFGSSPLLEACIKNNVTVFSLLLEHKAKVDCFDRNGDTPLHLACQSGQTEILNLLLQYDIHSCINRPNAKGYTPFYLAISNGQHEMAKTVIKYGADPNCSNDDGLTPLHITSLHGYSDLSSFIIDNYELQINSKDKTGKTPLHLACSKGNAIVANLLIKYNAEVNQMDNDKVTPFMLACSSGNIELIKFLLTKNVDINAFSSFGSSPLLEACIKDNVKVFSLLLENKAKVDCFNKNGDTPLHLACQSGQTEILNVLIKYDINSCINKPNVKGYTPFYLAISNGKYEIAETIIKNGADPNRQNDDGLTPLHITSLLGYSDLSSFLMDNYKTQIKSRDNTGKTPLHMACSKGNAVVAKLLINYNAEVNEMDNDKVTPFMLACSSGNIELIKFLLTKNVDINAFSSFGSSPLLEACIKDNVKVFSLLLEKNANVDCFDRNGDSPLHLACKAGQTKILNLLIKHNLNACINKPNVKGYTPFYLAISNGHNEIAKTIVKYGADPNYQNDDGLTPLHIACETNSSEIVKILLEQYHVESNKKDNKARTPLDVSSLHKHTDTSKLIIERGKLDENIVSIPVTSSSTC